MPSTIKTDSHGSALTRRRPDIDVLRESVIHAIGPTMQRLTYRIREKRLAALQNEHCIVCTCA